MGTCYYPADHDALQIYDIDSHRVQRGIFLVKKAEKMISLIIIGTCAIAMKEKLPKKAGVLSSTNDDNDKKSGRNVATDRQTDGSNFRFAQASCMCCRQAGIFSHVSRLSGLRRQKLVNKR